VQIPYNRYGANFSRRRSHFSFRPPEAEGDLLGYGVASTAPTITRLLKVGTRGEDVKAVQARLIELGFLPAGEDDGIFGAKTKAATQAFQSSVGRTPSGAIGRGTIEALWAPASFDSSKILSWLETAQTATEYFTPRGRRQRARRTVGAGTPVGPPVDQTPRQPIQLEEEYIQGRITPAALLDPGDEPWKKWALAAAGGLTLLLIVLVARRR
jgi:peptidoglycan hydrolase-like protein with peptidoglycan-binding domain